MEMSKILKLILVTAILILSFKPALAQWQEEYDPGYEGRIIRTPAPNLDIDVWIDEGEGSTYYPGDEIYIYFRASRDCYVVIYNLDTKGYVNMLYPYDYSDDPWVEGGRVYRIPNRFADYSLTIDGPSGVEYVQAVASYEPLSPPNWPSYHGGIRSEPEEIVTLRMDEDEDPYVFMEWVNHRIRPHYDYVTDICRFYVRYPHPRWYYHPHLYWEYPYSFPYHLGSVYIWAPFAAEIYIDGIFFGIAPITIPAVVIGRHYVTVYYNGCRVWDDYVYVERSKTVRLRTDFSDRIRYVSSDPVKKEYRSWKEKEYRHVRERRTTPEDKQVRARSEYIQEKSSRVEGKTIRDRERDRTEYEARKEARKSERDFIREKERIEREKYDDRQMTVKKESSRENKFKTERSTREGSYSGSKSSKSSSPARKTVTGNKGKSGGSSKSAEVQKSKSTKGR